MTEMTGSVLACTGSQSYKGTPTAWDSRRRPRKSSLGVASVPVYAVCRKHDQPRAQCACCDRGGGDSPRWDSVPTPPKILRALNALNGHHTPPWAAAGGPWGEGSGPGALCATGPRALVACSFKKAAGGRTVASPPGTKLPSYYLQRKAPPNSITLSGGAVT